MHWTEPATSDDSHAALEKTLWDAANQLWSNVALKPSEYSPTVLGLIFLKGAQASRLFLPRQTAKMAVPPSHAAGVVYLPDEARFSHLLSRPEGANVGPAVNEAMRAIPAAVPTRNLPRHSETKPGGQERVGDTARLARLNLAVHGLSGDIKQGTPTTRTSRTPSAASTS